MWQQQQVWQLLISAFHVFLLTAAKATITATTSSFNTSPSLSGYRPAATAAVSGDLWEHVNKTCLSRVCNETLNVQHLQQLERNMRREANPCADFHAYACGNWAREHPHSPIMMQVTDDALTERYVQLFERALTGDATSTSRLEKGSRGRLFAQTPHLRQPMQADHEPVAAAEHNLVFAKMLRYYSACKESAALASAPPTLRGYVEQLTDERLWRTRGQHWQETLALLGRYGSDEQFVRVAVQRLNASQEVIMVAPHDRGRKLNLTADIVEILREFTCADDRVVATEFQQLETDLEEIINSSCPNDATPQAQKEDDCDLVATYRFDELQQQCRDIDWQAFIGVQMGRHIAPDELILVDALDTVCKLARYFNQAEHSRLYSLYTLARFLGYLQQQAHSVLLADPSASISHTCVRHMRKTLNLPMTYVYERAYYGHVRAESDRVIRSIFAQLKAEFARTLARNRMQLDADIVAYLQQKLLALRLNIGNLPLNVTDHYYVDYVRQLNVSGNFYRNHLHALQHTYAQQRRLATAAAVDAHSAWHSFHFHNPTFSDDVDAAPYYLPLQNIIIVPHAYLQTPFYDERFWPVLLYGDLATTLGHELIHSFDNRFLGFDYAGNKNDIYESIRANPNFSRNLACLADGTQFLSERVADVSGTRLALNTFFADPQFLQRNGKLFFLQFAQFFCGAPDLATHQLHDPTHDLGSLRLNYTLAHLPEFAAVFGCPASAAMQPPQRCELW